MLEKNQKDDELNEFCPICNNKLKFLIKRKDEYSYYYCNNCKLITSLPKPTDDEIINYYKGFLYNKPKDNAFTQKSKLILKDVGKIVNDISEFKKINAELKLLDFGGGLGFYSYAFSKFNFDVTVSDIDEQSCDYAKAKFKNKFKIIRADPMEFNFKDKFDVIFCNQVIEHCKDINLFLDIMKKILKPDGLLIITTPNQRCKEFFFRPLWLLSYIYVTSGFLPKRILKFIEMPWICCDPPRHIHSFNDESISTLLKNKGFKILSIFTEYSIFQYYSLKMHSNFKLNCFKKIILDVYPQIGIRMLKFIDKNNEWGNNLVVYAKIKRSENYEINKNQQ